MLAAVAAVALFGVDRALAYTSPFTINITAPPSWFSDLPARTALVTALSSPDPSHWSSTVYPNPSWGPLNPQLYAVPEVQIAEPGLVTALQFDRGQPVYGTSINTPPPGESFLGWAGQRLMAVAQSMIGTAYQHLHLPQFDPAQVQAPGSFNWLAVSTGEQLQTSQQLMAGQPGTQPNPYKASYGQPAPGIDCTDFTAYVYNLALGYQLHSGTGNQVVFPEGGGAVGGNAAATVLDGSGAVLKPTFFYGPNYGRDAINAPGSLDALISQLQPGDLLYIGNRQQILHVVMWLGELGLNGGSASTVPLVISSHDNTPAIFDTQAINLQPGDLYGFPLDGQIEAHLPPPGVHILPFTDQNWFYQDFQLAMRILPSQAAPAPVPAPALPGWAVLVVAQRLRRVRRRALSRRSEADRLGG